MLSTSGSAPEGGAKIVTDTLQDFGYFPEPVGGKQTRGLFDRLRFLLSPEKRAHLAGAPQPEGRKVCGPLPVMNIPGRFLGERNCFEWAQFAGWRYLVPDASAMVDLQPSEMLTDNRSDEVQPGKITRGPVMDSVCAATQLADKAFARKPASYEIGIIEVPALQVAAVSIKGNDELYFICYKDPRPAHEMRVETGREFAHHLGDLLEVMGEGKIDASNLKRLEFPKLPSVQSPPLREASIPIARSEAPASIARVAE